MERGRVPSRRQAGAVCGNRFIIICCLGTILPLLSLADASGQLAVRVVDVGAGLCCVAVTSDEHYMIYDAGNYRDRGESAMVAIAELIPFGSTIDLMVLSHCDADHIAAVPFICENYRVREVWRDGFDSGTQTWARADDAIAEEVADDGCEDVNLQHTDVEPGYEVEVGNATVTFLCGFADIPSAWGVHAGGENRNARSIVVRMDHGASSIMFAGDTVGRHIGDSWNTNIAAEAFMVNNSVAVPIDVDVLIAPHHGADNASSYPFILATSPEYVVFSAGSHYQHPHYWAANRYLASGVPSAQIFRTDRGDNEGGGEWWVGNGSVADAEGDDDVEIRLFPSGSVQVTYAPSVAPEAPAFGPRRRIAAIAKWIENDALWTETHEDLEDHTITRPDRMPCGVYVPQQVCTGAAPSCRCAWGRRTGLIGRIFSRRCR